MSLYNDKNNNIWAGSVRCGLISVREVSMKTYTEVIAGNNKGLSSNMVLSLYQDTSSDEIWIGTDGGGINKLNPVTEEFTHYPNTVGDKVVSITGFSSSKLLLSLFSKGVYVFDKLTGQYRPLEIKDKEINRLLFYTGKSVNIYQHAPQVAPVVGLSHLPLRY